MIMLSKAGLGPIKDKKDQTSERAKEAPRTKRNPSAIKEEALLKAARFEGGDGGSTITRNFFSLY